MRKTIKGVGSFLIGLHPLRLVILGYISYIVLGWILLSIPFAQHGPGATALDNLFISTSAMSTTGLATVSVTDSYTLFGQIVILLLIQLGGIGYMTFSSFVILSHKKALSDKRTEIANVVFSLPDSFRVDKFLRSVILFTAAIETAGAASLYFIFKQAEQPHALWSAIFHSISSFCTAGFSLYNNSFESFKDNFWLNATVGVLSYTGAVGFIVCVDVWRRVTNKIPSITLTSKIILHCTFWVSLIGTAILFVSEPSIQHLPVDERLVASFFQAMTSLTTVGFNTISISDISRASLLLLTTLMIIGASPSGTGGGLKSTTFTALIGIMRSSLQGQKHIYFRGKRIPAERVRLAVATFCFYMAFLLLGVYLLTLTEQMDFEAILFESASALGTVGLSVGITAKLSCLGKLVVTFLMFVGRLGPLTFGMSLFLRQTPPAEEQDEDVAI